MQENITQNMLLKLSILNREIISYCETLECFIQTTHRYTELRDPLLEIERLTAQALDVLCVPRAFRKFHERIRAYIGTDTYEKLLHDEPMNPRQEETNQK